MYLFGTAGICEDLHSNISDLNHLPYSMRLGSPSIKSLYLNHDGDDQHNHDEDDQHNHHHDDHHSDVPPWVWSPPLLLPLQIDFLSLLLSMKRFDDHRDDHDDGANDNDDDDDGNEDNCSQDYQLQR